MMDMRASSNLDLETVKRLAVLYAVYAIGVPLARGIYAHFLRPAKKLTKYGRWAVVTGATDGIGRALCDEFAKRGLDVLLVSRTPSKLEASAAELKAAHPARNFKTLAVDFGGGFDAAKRGAVAAAVDGLDVGVLCNNVGLSYDFTTYFHEIGTDRVADLVALNVESTLHVTRIVLGGMVSRKRGCVVNTSSAAGTTASPLLAGYAACKGGVVAFSHSLYHELAPLGIAVQVQTPLWVTTKLAKIRRASLTVPTPKAYAKVAADAIGHGPASCPYWAHDLALWLQSKLPTSVAAKIVYDMHIAIRKKGLRKLAEKQKAK